MITFKCKMCGGDLEFEQGASVAECPYCGTTQTLPKLDDDKRANMYDRANHFRRQNEFDKAMSIYEQILQEDRSDAEAYWSLVLCRYGIEYVEDPVSHKRVPTVNRVQYASILADEDYKSALQYADTIQRGVYEAEANAIAEIQKGILDISKKEKPFDVFICYKETDANGRRTPDSVLANDMYHQLTKEGFKVFFSRITLEDKIGTAYEPYIFAALNSAKVMVVLGTKPEYFNAVWVKNEWSRYLALIRAGADKTLVPAYRDMDPYDLPDEFAHLQAQDMGKLGFMQDLIRGIKKIAGKDEAKAPSVVQQVVSGGANIDNLMRRARIFMEDANWTSATEYLDKVLDENAEYAPAYAGKVQVQQKLRKQEELSTCLNEYEKSADWEKALRFATPEQRKIYEEYVAGALVTREEKRKNDIYTKALNMLHAADTPEACKEAKKTFLSVPDYRDSIKKQAKCDVKAAQIEYQRVDEKFRSVNAQKASIDKVDGYKKVADAFRRLGDNQDAQQRAERCLQLADETREVVYQDACRKINTSIQDQDFAYALSVLRALGPQYKDASALIDECIERRKKATAYRNLNEQTSTLSRRKPSLQDIERWQSLSKQYGEFGELWDAESRIYTCEHAIYGIQKHFYDEAVDAMKNAETEWNYSQAARSFKELGDYSDAPAKAKECERLAASIKAEADRKAKTEAAKARNKAIVISLVVVAVIAVLVCYFSVIQPNGIYNKAVEALNAGSYDEASELFANLGNYKDAAQRVPEPFYRCGEKLYAEGNYIEAAGMFKKASGWTGSEQAYSDAMQRYHDTNYEYGMECYRNGDYASAIIPLSCSAREDGEQLAEELRMTFADRVVIKGSKIYAIKSDGSVLACGDNKDGLLNVGSWRDIIKIEPGTFHTAGLKSDGTVVVVYDDYIKSSEPQQMEEWTDVVDIKTYHKTTLALHSNGTCSIYDNDQFEYYNVNGWNDIIQLCASDHNIAGLKANGTVISSGNNEHGQQNKVSSFSDVKHIEMGCWKILGLTTDGRVLYSGWTEEGEEEAGTWTDMKKILRGGSFYTVGLKNDGTVIATEGFRDFRSSGKRWTASTLSKWDDIVDIACDDDDIVVGLKRDGTVVIAGKIYEDYSDEIKYKVDEWDNVISVYAGYGGIIGLRSDGSLLYAGDNEKIQASTVNSWKLW